eukprot:306164_1
MNIETNILSAMKAWRKDPAVAEKKTVAFAEETAERTEVVKAPVASRFGAVAPEPEAFAEDEEITAGAAVFATSVPQQETHLAATFDSFENGFAAVDDEEALATA